MAWYDRIKSLRIDNDLTQAELAKELNISIKTLQRYENGTGEPPITTLLQLSKIFNKSIDFISCNPINNSILINEEIDELREAVNELLNSKKKI